MMERHGTYIGPRKELKGKRALVKIERHYVQDMIPSHGEVVSVTVTAQFDDVATGLGHGWHNFRLDDFDIDPKENHDGE